MQEKLKRQKATITRKDKVRDKALEMESYRHDSGYEDDRFQGDVGRNFHCPICMNVFKDPVMCQRNQHCFCRPCITRHLGNSQTCPTCMEELTQETLNEAPRILTDCLSDLNIRCDYSSRGCCEFVQLGDLEIHVKNCGFSPVVCSNQGCLVEINKQDKTHHETEICEFRKVKCHDCVEVRKDIDEMKINMTTLTEKLDRELKALKDEVEEIKINQTALNYEIKKNQTAVNNEMKEMKLNLSEIKEQLATLTHQVVHSVQMEKGRATSEIGDAKIESTKEKTVVIAGGSKDNRIINSVEKLCWSTELWSPLRPMKEHRLAASSFVFKNQLIVTGGCTNLRNGLYTDTMERVNIDPVMDSERWFDFPANLRERLSGHSCVIYDEKLIVIGGFNGKECSDRIHEVLLVPPYTSRYLTRMPQARRIHGAQLFNDKILIFGGMETKQYRDSVDSVIMYDISKNECKQMSPLPYVVCEMATVSWGDNVIVIGGAGKDGKALNTVVIYNVKTEKSHMLPAMKYRRKGCVAVVVGSSIVVMGGKDENYLDAVESFSFDRYSWKDLPPMNVARYKAAAVAW